MTYMKAAAAALMFALTACSDDPTGPTTGEVITLTAAQAAALVAKVESFGGSDPSLAALSDTIQVVVKAGAQARRIDVTTDLGDVPFWAVSLHMTSTVSSPASSAFHVIAFDEPSNPTRFIILGGWAQGSGSTPPTTVSGQIGGAATISLTGHLFSASGSQVSAWHAIEGSSTLTSSAAGTSCPGFAGPGTCVPATMDATFDFTGSTGTGNSSTFRSASGTVTGIPGIRLSH